MEKKRGGYGRTKTDDGSTIRRICYRKLSTQGHDRMGIMVTVGTFRVPVPDIWHPFLFLLCLIS